MRHPLLLLLVFSVACGDDSATPRRDAGLDDAGRQDTGGSDAAVRSDAAGPSDAGTDGARPGVDGGRDAGSASVTSGAVLGRLGSCMRIGGDYATDSGGAETVPVCGDTGVVWWRADMDIDCDGGRQASCMADPWYLPETSATDSSGDPLDANTLPFVVVPLPSSRFRYADHGIDLGQVALVIYAGRMEWAIFGDQGPSGIIGEGSYALAESLGIDSDPATGGVDSGVTFVLFTGDGGRVTHNEDHDEAVRLGETLARDFLATP